MRIDELLQIKFVPVSQVAMDVLVAGKLSCFSV